MTPAANANPRRAFAVRLTLLLLCIAGVFAPIGVFPVSSPSCIAFAISLCGISLTCMWILPGLWRVCFYPQGPLAIWPDESRKLKAYRAFSKVTAWLGISLIAISLFFFHRWHRGQINLQSIIAAPGAVLWLWSAVAKVIITAHRPEPSGQRTGNAEYGIARPQLFS